jgi:death on curing protein
MESFLVLNGYEITAGVDEQERIFLDVAAGVMNRESFCRWVETHITKLPEVS